MVRHQVGDTSLGRGGVYAGAEEVLVLSIRRCGFGIPAHIRRLLVSHEVLEELGGTLTTTKLERPLENSG